MSYANPIPLFPTTGWDGKTPANPDLTVEKYPDIEMKGRFRSEITAIAGFLIDHQADLDTLQNKGNPGEVLAVSQDGLELIWREIIGIGGVSINYTADTIEISVAAVDVDIDYEAIAGEDIEAGTPVRVQGGEVFKAIADDLVGAKCRGLATQSKLLGETIKYKSQLSIERPSWFVITGDHDLTVGAVYYLSPTVPGQLTTVAPTTEGYYVVRIGAAVSPLVLDINIQPPIKL